MNYTEALEFFAENGIQLTSEQLDNLKEASAFTRHMRNASKEYNDTKKVKDLSNKLTDKMNKIYSDDLNYYHSDRINPSNYDYKKDNSDYLTMAQLKDAKQQFNNRVNNKHRDNTKGRNDHKTAGDYLNIQKAKKLLEK